VDTKLTFEAQDTLRQSIAEARETNRPSLIACRTIIGYGAPYRPGSKKIHGRAARWRRDRPHPPGAALAYAPFEISEDVLARRHAVGARGRMARHSWMARQEKLDAAQREGFESILQGKLSREYDDALRQLETRFADEFPKIATWQVSQQVLEALTPVAPNLLGGSAE